MTNINIKLVSPQLTQLNFDLDGDCALCKRGLQKLIKLQARNTNAYGSRNLTTGKRIGKVQIVPDYNSFGIVTHWHIQ